MLRSFVSRGLAAARTATTTSLSKHKPVVTVIHTRHASSGSVVIDPAGIREGQMLETLRSENMTCYDLRSVFNELRGNDTIPSAEMLEALILACRKVNDYAAAVRILESVMFTCSGQKELYDKVIAPVIPTLEKLGISTPAQMGYDKPELFLKCSFDIH